MSVTWTEGTPLPPLELPAITRTMLALYAGGSGDHNPLHVDTDFARDVAQMDDVIGHGMFGMALLARYVTSFADQAALKDFGVRFQGMTRVGDILTCDGRIERLFDEAGSAMAELSLRTVRQNGDVVLTGSAIVAVA